MHRTAWEMMIFGFILAAVGLLGLVPRLSKKDPLVPERVRLSRSYASPLLVGLGILAVATGVVLWLMS